MNCLWIMQMYIEIHIQILLSLSYPVDKPPLLVKYTIFLFCIHRFTVSELSFYFNFLIPYSTSNAEAKPAQHPSCICIIFSEPVSI